MPDFLDFPYSFDGHGRTAATGRDDHVRDLVEQVLLTTPGERVMRPDFGSGLLAMVFEPGGAEVAAAARYLVQASLERELSDLITLAGVEIDAVDAGLVVTVSYAVRRTQSHSVATFAVPGGGS